MALDCDDNVKSTAFTNTNGCYEMSGLATGTYVVKVTLDNNTIAEDDNISVTDGASTNKDFSCPGGSISGTVLNSSEDPIEGVFLTAVKNDKAYRAVSNANGSYIIRFLTAGDYQVLVNPNDGNYEADRIDDVTVIVNQETSNQDFTLGSDGKISGTITNTSQEDIEGALVFAINPNDPNEAYIPTFSNANGGYVIAHLRTGTYTIFVCINDYVSDSETNASVIAGQTTSGKNFVLSDSGGTISGTVYESDGQTPISGAFVNCESEGKSWRSTLSDGNGDYFLPLLQAGTYEVTACADGYESELLDNILVTGTQDNSDNDFTLDTK
jgi:hypothetical protein